MNRFVLAVMALTGVAFAQPVVSSATNAAGYMRPGLPNGGLAQGSFIAIFGQRIGPAVPSTGIAVSGYPLQATYQGVSARIGSTDLLIVYASPGQVGAIVPSTTPIGSAPLTVTFNGQTSAAVTVNVVQRAFGIFTLNQAGSGPVVGLKFISQAAQPPSTLIEALNPGGTITLFGTGLGASANPDNQTATNTTVTGLDASNVEVLIGGRRAPVRFVGRSTCCSAIDQIVADIPADTPLGCYVPLLVRVGGVPSNSSTISIAAPGKRICSDPNGLTEAQLERAIAQGSLAEGFISLSKTSVQIPVIGEQKTDNLSATFLRYSLNDLIRRIPDEDILSVTVGSCRAFTFASTSEDQSTEEIDPISGAGLDAGPQLTATAGGRTQTLDKPAPPVAFNGSYFKVIQVGGPSIPLPVPIPGVGGGEEFLTTGVHRVTGPGGPQVGAFTAEINWPAAFVWTNQASIAAVNRSAGQTVTWSGGDPNGFVSIFGSSSSLVGQAVTGAAFVCIAEAGARTFTVPTSILSVLPASGSIQGNPLGALVVSGVSRPVSFTASGLDAGYITYSGTSLKSLNYQ